MSNPHSDMPSPKMLVGTMASLYGLYVAFTLWGGYRKRVERDEALFEETILMITMDERTKAERKLRDTLHPNLANTPFELSRKENAELYKALADASERVRDFYLP